MDHLFVYGTLAPGRPNARVLADVPGEWREGLMTGRIRGADGHLEADVPMAWLRSG
jgi:gamma-glutamylcyclotransferase (GGCT)/AIG2-like uncharacterized protein YtfP